MTQSSSSGEWHDPVRPQPVKVDVVHIIEVGMAVWVVALVVLLAVPSLHQGGRDWWPWVPVISLALGAIAWFYVRRGRGNASAA